MRSRKIAFRRRKVAAGVLFLFYYDIAVKKIRIYLQKVADNNIIELKEGWDCHVKEI